MNASGSSDAPASSSPNACTLSEPGQPHGHGKQAVLGLALAALGIVYGDIGTSPLYAIKECFHGLHAIALTRENILGVLSLVFWSLTMVVSVKYVVFITRADNRGEGGIFALLALLSSKGENKTRAGRTVLVSLAVFGAALLYGDGIITPAISVLSAIEGLNVATDRAADFVVPLTCAILLGLFLIQRRGTEAIGKVFGPVMVVWFVTIGALGLIEIVLEPAILAALNPWHAVNFFLLNTFHGAVALGSVVLCITGGEALYADMGHFGRPPIKLSWFALVFPALLLNYFGQGALLLDHPELAFNPFYGLAPEWLLYPMVALATAATVIASQAMISGVYSLTQQAIQLGFCPRLHIQHTSSEAMGQIYLPTVNWALMLACLGLVLAFRESSRLAAAYGIAVTATMGITSIIYFVVVRERWGWKLIHALPLVTLFLLFDVAFLGANLLKIFDGGWFTLTVAGLVMLCMVTWRDGRAMLARRFQDSRVPLDKFLVQLEELSPPRTQGTAVFMSLSPSGVPIALLHFFKHANALHERIIFLTIRSVDIPAVPDEERVRVEDLGQGFYRISANYGFMETPAMPQILELAACQGLEIDIHATSFFLGRETLMVGTAPGMASWRKRLFVFMSRNSWNVTSFFKLPPGRVVELGSQVEL